MTTLAAVGRRVLPRGWGDLAKQLAIWFGCLFAYQAARGIADRNPPKAFDNGLKVIGFERHMHGLIELSFQRFVDSSQFLMNLASWTYWNSEFTVVALALLWVYLRRHEAFTRFRNAILLANVIGLVGYVLLPTAPPRMFPDFGFDDTLSQFASLNHGSGLDASGCGRAPLSGADRPPADCAKAAPGDGCYGPRREPNRSDRLRQAGLHRRGPAPRLSLYRSSRAHACEPECADGRGRAPLYRGRGRDPVRGPQQLPLLLACGGALHRRLDPRHPRRRARPSERQGDAVRRVPRLALRPGQRRVRARSNRLRVRARRRRHRGHLLRRGGRRLLPRFLRAREGRADRPQGRRRHRQPCRARDSDRERADPWAARRGAGVGQVLAGRRRVADRAADNTVRKQT